MADSLTKQAIRKAFVKMLNEKPFNKITVKDIVEECVINRNTFYYHYADLYDLLSEIFNSELQTAIDKYNNNLSWEEGFLIATQFALDNRKAVYHVYNSIHKEELVKYLYNISNEIMTRFIQKESVGISASDTDKKIIISFYQCALTAMVIEWVSGGMKEDPDFIIRRIGVLFRGHISDSLKISADLNNKN